MIFEDLPPTPTAEELIDKAFSRAARAGRASSGVGAQRSMVTTASTILRDNLEHTVTAWPDFDVIHPFYFELADAIVGVDSLRQSLARVQWANRQVETIATEAIDAIRASPKDARDRRKQAFARFASVIEDIEPALEELGDARWELASLPDIDPDAPTIVVAGYPNVGKSTFVNAVTNARNQIAEYPFTTTTIQVGHVEHRYVQYQLVDTPGLLDRPPEDRNEIESQAVSALRHLADVVLVFVDPSESCGYPLETQLRLRDSLAATFSDRPVLTVGAKADLSTDVEASIHISTTEGTGADSLVEMAIEAADYEPELPTAE